MLRLLLLLFCSNLVLAGQTITLFVHGIHDSHKQAEPFTHIIPNLHTINFDCSKAHGSYPLNAIASCSLGQDNELEQLHHALEELRERFPNADGFVLIGISAGASAIINYLVRYSPEMITAVVLESPFDNIKHVVDYRAERYGIKGMFEQIDQYIPFCG
jgi:alpha-beta hydrolase superfamily lysophospholipase